MLGARNGPDNNFLWF